MPAVFPAFSLSLPSLLRGARSEQTGASSEILNIAGNAVHRREGILRNGRTDSLRESFKAVLREQKLRAYAGRSLLSKMCRVCLRLESNYSLLLAYSSSNFLRLKSQQLQRGRLTNNLETIEFLRKIE